MSNDSKQLNFHDFAWAALLFYYKSVADKKYCKIMSDTEFLTKLRQTPFEIEPAELEQKVILDYVNIESYDLLVKHKMAEQLLEKMVGLQPDISALRDFTLIDCDLSDNEIIERIKRIYSTLYTVDGLWLTGTSKIAHLLNDKLLVLLNPDISEHFHLPDGSTALVDWLKIMQDSARQVTDDFHNKGFSGTPEAFLSEKIGYAKGGYYKSMVKFLDEYYRLAYADMLPIPPSWIP